MPKSAPSTPSKRAARANSGTPKRSPKTQSPQKPPAVVDESTWRASTIRLGTTIKKGSIKDLYGIRNPEDVGLKPCRREKIKKVIKGKLTLVTMILYNERDVELAAWRQHGGPDEFHAFLKKRHEEHKAKNPGKAFEAPRSYFSALQPAPLVQIVSFGGSGAGPTDIYANTTELIRLKAQMIEKARGDDWLWEACNRSIWGKITSNNLRERHILTAFERLPAYPPRTRPPTTLSLAFQALKTLLAEAPMREDDDYDLPMRNYGNLRVDENSWPSYEEFYWSKPYLTRIYRALMDIIEAHGTGPDGWATARWMVYDKYAEWDGIHLDLSNAEDKAYPWLQPRLAPGVRPRLEYAMFPDQDVPPPIWEEYNAMLPVV
ncbi:hypothetical protein DFP72DRAFT_903703 [Ephemerocybe angulata]|uniref:Uncharacterized protein n=1 Tax=Ephemerocybe angulata TaxID=980116 RepID=A0A8H6HTB0_9AGAR|nr:hypothetical protein DFP72DRAFT_903703 [Tulosesus angulatus]